MPIEDVGTFRRDAKGNTGRLYVPAALVRDSAFPLRPGKVEIQICDDTLVITNADPNSTPKGLSVADES